MARLPTSASRTVTTYRSKNSPSSRKLGASLKASADKQSLKKNQKKAAVKKGKEFAAVDSYDDEESMGSEDEDDDGIDPNLKAMVKQSGLTAHRAKLKPAVETPTTSRTLVARQFNRFPPLPTSVSKHNVTSKLHKDTTDQDDEDQDSEGDKLSFSNDENDGLGNFQQQIQDMKKKTRFTADMGKQGKENVEVKVASRGHGRERDAERKTGKGKYYPYRPDSSRLTVCITTAVSSHANRSHGKSKPYDPPTTRKTSKSRHQPKAPDAHVSKPVSLTRTYDMASDDTEGTESSNDQRVFGMSAEEHARREGGREETDEVEESDETESSDDEVENVDEELDYGHRGVTTEVRDIATVFKAIRKLMQYQANGVQKKLYDELQPMHRATEKMYKQLGGAFSEKMIAQQSLKEKSLEQHREMFHPCKREMRDDADHLEATMQELLGQYAKIKERKNKMVERGLRQFAELEKKQAKDIENLEKELDQYRNKYKAKAEKVLDPTVLNAKFAKQRKYIYQEVGI